MGRCLGPRCGSQTERPAGQEGEAALRKLRQVGSSRFVLAAFASLVVLACGSLSASGAPKPKPPKGEEDVARYILPPGNFGGIPLTDESTDQLPLYSGLTPLRDDITP